MKRVFLGAILACACFNLMQAESLEERKARLQAELNSIESDEVEIKELEEKIKAKKLQQSQPNSQAQQNLQTQQKAKEQTKQAQQNLQNKQNPQTQNADESKNRNGVLLGFGVGSMPTESKFSIIGIDIAGVKSSFVPVGARLGVQYFGENDKILGFRFYGDYYYMSASDKNSKSTNKVLSKQTLWTINGDILVDFHIPNTYAYVGLFAGVGYGQINYNAADSVKLTYSGGFLNYGVALTLGAKHRLEFSVKNPFENEYNKNGVYYKTNSLMQFVYQYTF